jgi:hypothetical protein
MNIIEEKKLTKKIEKTYYNNQLEGIRIEEYDNYKLNKTTYYNNQNVIRGYTEHNYNNNNLLVSDKHFNADNSIKFEFIIEYDDQNRIIKTTHTGANITVSFTHNSDNTILSRETIRGFMASEKKFILNSDGLIYNVLGETGEKIEVIEYSDLRPRMISIPPDDYNTSVTTKIWYNDIAQLPENLTKYITGNPTNEVLVNNKFYAPFYASEKLIARIESASDTVTYTYELDENNFPTKSIEEEIFISNSKRKTETEWIYE